MGRNQEYLALLFDKGYRRWLVDRTTDGFMN
jgi:hypothetical protein